MHPAQSQATSIWSVPLWAHTCPTMDVSQPTGVAVSVSVGRSVGVCVGGREGVVLGEAVGLTVGMCDGATVGRIVGGLIMSHQGRFGFTEQSVHSDVVGAALHSMQ